MYMILCAKNYVSYSSKHSLISVLIHMRRVKQTFSLNVKTALDMCLGIINKLWGC